MGCGSSQPASTESPVVVNTGEVAKPEQSADVSDISSSNTNGVETCGNSKDLGLNESVDPPPPLLEVNTVRDIRGSCASVPEDSYLADVANDFPPSPSKGYGGDHFRSSSRRVSAFSARSTADLSPWAIQYAR